MAQHPTHISSSQLTLPIVLNDEATFDNFYVTEQNRQLVTTLKNSDNWLEPFIYLFGPSKCGCSHLLQAACQQAAEQNRLALYLPMQELLAYPAHEMLDGLESLDLICIDDIHLISAQREWEEGIFHLYNKVKEKQGRLLIAAHQSPKQLQLSLADLESRLQWGITYKMSDYSDEDLVFLIAHRARSRGLLLVDEVAHYLVSRAKRDPAELMSILEKLDILSLQSGRKLTIPFIKTALNW